MEPPRYQVPLSLGEDSERVYHLTPYLCLRTLRELGLAVVALRNLGLAEMVAKFRDALAGLSSLRGDVFSWCALMCFSSSSPMLALRSAMGIRLMRRSIRARRSLAWRAY